MNLSSKNKTLLAPALLVAATFAAFWGVIDNGFVNLDDGTYVTNNPLITSFSLEHLKEILATFYKDDYRFITILLSYTAEYQLVGLDPWLYHLDNLLLHTANTVLVFFLARRLSGSDAASLITALFFSVHPAQVEAVAWISERKGLMSGLFYLGAMALYMRYREGGERSRLWYGLSLAVFLLALLSKLVAVTLPAILLLVDYLQRRELSWRLVIDKIPYGILSLVFVLDTLFIYETTEQLGADEPMSITEIVLVGFNNIYSYLKHIVYPVGLSASYPYPEKIGITEPGFLAAIVVVLACGAFTVWSLRYTRKAAFGVLFFLLTISPVLQLVPFVSGGSVIADRYLYLPSVGLFFIMAVGLARVWGSGGSLRGPARAAVVAVVVVSVVACGVLTSRRVEVWSGSIPLWEDTLSRHPGSAMARHNLANAYAREGRNEEAARLYGEVVELNPGAADVYFDYANILVRLDRYAEAARMYERALEIDPVRGDVHYRLGSAYSRLGLGGEAARQYRAAVELLSGEEGSRYELGNALFRLGRVDEAIDIYRKALEVDPGRPEVHNNLGIAYAVRGDYEAAAGAFEKALELDPGNEDARANLLRAGEALGEGGGGGAE